MGLGGGAEAPVRANHSFEPPRGGTTFARCFQLSRSGCVAALRLGFSFQASGGFRPA